LATVTELTDRTHVCQESIKAALRDLGLGAGDVVLVHSSLSSMGYVVGGASTVIEAFLAVLDPSRGTLVLPTLCQRDIDKRFEIWDIDQSPSDVGRITEVGRLRPDAVRSDHPTHSVAAIGARAEEITRDHGNAHDRPSPWGPAAFGIGSPWEKLYEWNAHYLFLGVTTSCNTIGHFAQSRFVEECLEQAGERREGLEAEVKGWQKEGVWPNFGFEVVEQWLREKGLMRYGQLGEAVLRATRARDNVDTILDKLRTVPETFLKQDFMDWYRRGCGA
jgi:aminoglycoside 3-N-acetyltransferase